MLSKLAKLGVVFLAASLFTACASSPFYHKNFMRGQVVDVSDLEAVLCIGSNDKSQHGKILSVYRVVYITDSVSEGEDLYLRDYVGEIQISNVINKHFARARINSGMVKKHDIVEFK